MIDLIDIKIQLQHKPFGNERIKLIENSPSSSPISTQFSKTVTLRPNGSPVDVTSLDNGSIIHIRDSPLTPLQGHNVFGSNDVCLLGSHLICGVLDQLQIPYSDEQREAWQAGEYDIDALDITQRFALPENVSQKQLFKHMLRNAPWDFRPAVISAGTGIRLAAPRRNATWVLYDKQQKLRDLRTKSLRYLRAVAGEYAPRIWNGLWAAAGNSVRVELKLSKEYLRKHQLNRGSAWTVQRVHQVYWTEMTELRFELYVPLRQLRDTIDSVKSRPLRRTLELWARSTDLDTLYPKSTVDRHRSQIRRLIGIDIRLDVPMVEALPLADIFSRVNQRPVFPAWSRKFPVCAFGALTERSAECDAI